MTRLSNRATVVIGALNAAVIGALIVSVTTADAAKYLFKTPSGLTISQTSPTTAKASWTAVKKAKRYRVQLSTRSNMSEAVYARSTGKTASGALSGLKASTTYYAKVRVITTRGANRSPYSKTTSFKTAKTGALITKILVFIEENHSLSQMKTGMPYSYSLAKMYGYASNFTAIQHPSLPNYIALAAGDTLKVNDDKVPSPHVLNGKTVFGQAITAGTPRRHTPTTCPQTSPLVRRRRPLCATAQPMDLFRQRANALQ